MKTNSEEFKLVRSKDNFLVLGAPAIEDAEIDEVVACMKSGWLGTGPKVARLDACPPRLKAKPMAGRPPADYSSSLSSGKL